MDRRPPKIIDAAADAEYGRLAASLGFDPDGRWHKHYVDRVWARPRHVFETVLADMTGQDVLEFGCNFGATSIVLAKLGAKVTAIDINADFLALAERNAERYGVADKIEVLHTPDTTKLPFEAERFGCVSCNSVLEYVDHRLRGAVMREIDRVLHPNGRLFVLGTPNRIWPVETHCRRWFINYLPRALDKVFFGGQPLMRGVAPWTVLGTFRGYENFDLSDRARCYIEARRRAGASRFRLRLLVGANAVLAPFGLSVGLVMPTISVTLIKPR